jgi:hypothetical protein
MNSVSAAVPPLSPDHVTHFRQYGWVASRAFLTPTQIKTIAQWTDELTAAPEVPGRHWVYREPDRRDPERKLLQRIENFCPFHAGFDALVRGAPLVAAVEQLLEAPAVLFKDKINFKLPGGGGFEPHQDQQAGWSRYAPLFLSALLSIDRATVENGCLELAHMPRARALRGQEWQPLTAHEMGGFPMVPAPTEPGDVIFFDSYVSHASKPNLSGDMRRILYLTYNRRSDGDHRERYYADKRASFPPDVERIPGKEYLYRV